MANKKPHPHLTFDEMKRLLAVIKSKRDYALVLIAYRHGLRASEIGLLTRSLRSLPHAPEYAVASTFC